MWYAASVAGAFLVALAAGWTPLASEIDNAAYDLMFRIHRPPHWQTHSVLLAIDEQTLMESGGVRSQRKLLAEALELVAPAKPRAVAIDIILADRGDPAEDARLERALERTPNLVLSCDLLPEGSAWDDPLPRFRRHAAAVGHVHANPDPVSRSVPLEKATARDRRWALALEAYRVGHGAQILESPRDLQIGNLIIPAARDDARAMRIRYVPPDMPPIPRVSLKQLKADPTLASLFRGKTVFVGITAPTAARDRLMTPYRTLAVGLDIHANAFETIEQGQFLTSAPEWQVLLLSIGLAAAAGLAFGLLSGWPAYATAALILASAHLAPYWLFTQGVVFPYSPPASVAWLTLVTAAAYQYLVVRRRLRTSEAEKTRYQHAVQFVTHEMRTPLTAIQGSSELMGRYALPEEKRKQIAGLIHSESKRLARMIEIFLNVERLSAGQMELKHEHFPVRDLVETCVGRARPLAERKQIRIEVEALAEENLTGDRELMEYAVYNLLTNAVKYSPPSTTVRVSGLRDRDRFRLAVKDEGIGMDRHEVKKIFQKFYRTRKAEQSGEAGTGIGLSIVEQIVIQHGGTIEVLSKPGQGSCFTLVLPARTAALTAERN